MQQAAVLTLQRDGGVGGDPLAGQVGRPHAAPPAAGVGGAAVLAGGRAGRGGPAVAAESDGAPVQQLQPRHQAEPDTQAQQPPHL